MTGKPDPGRPRGMGRRQRPTPDGADRGVPHQPAGADAPEAAVPASSELATLLDDITCLLGGMFDQIDWAEDEITQAQSRHPASSDLLHHSFELLAATDELMTQQFVYRAHCRELLDRLAGGQDTRPATTVEVICACCRTSMIAPMTTTGAGLYFRLWARAFPHKPVLPDGQRKHYEALHGEAIDDLEDQLRRTLARHDRVLGTPECTGRHHGSPGRCRYAHPGTTRR